MAVLSIIVPIYNGEKYLKKCLQSLCEQTFQDIEIILVDDGSSDNSPVICDEYAARDHRFKVIHKPNGGPTSAVREGLRAAGSEIIGFCDCDDWVAPEYFSVLYEALSGNDADLVGCGMTLVYAENEEAYNSDTSVVLLDGKDVLTRFLSGDAQFTIGYSRWSKLFRRTWAVECINEVAPDFRVGEDCAFVTEYLQRCGKIAFMEQYHGYFYRQVPTSIMHVFREALIDDNRRFIGHIDAFAQKYGYSFQTKQQVNDSVFANLLYKCAVCRTSVRHRAACCKRITENLIDPETAFSLYLKSLNPVLQYGFRLILSGKVFIGVCYVSAYCSVIDLLKRVMRCKRSR